MRSPFQSTRSTPPPVQSAAGTPPERAVVLGEFIQANAGALLQTLTLYIYKAGLAQGPEAKQVALELLSQLTIEALEHAERYDPQRPPWAWLLGIGINLIKQRRAAIARQTRREPFAREFREVRGEQDSMGDDEIFDRVAELRVSQGPSDGFEAKILNDDEIARQLARLTPDEQRIVLLAKEVGMNGQELARVLGITPGNARQRLFRALKKLSGEG